MKKYVTFKNLIIVLVIIRLAVFSSFFFSYGVDKLPNYPDADHYWGLAKSIYDDGTFRNIDYFTPIDALTLNQPHAFRTPGYPMFLSVFWNLGEPGYKVVPVVQFLLGLLSIYIGYLLAKKIFSEKTARIFTVIFLLEPTFLTVGFFLLSDILFIVFFLLTLHQAILFFKSQQAKNLALTSLFMVLAILIRPVLMYFPIIFLAVLLWHFRKSLKKFIRYSLLFALLLIAFLSPWYIRNYLTFNQLFLSTTPAYNGWRYYIGFWSGERDLADYWQQAQQKFREETGKNITEFLDFAAPENITYYKQKTREFLSDNFWLAVKNHVSNMFLETIDGRYYNYITEMYTGHTYTKGYSQFVSSANKINFIRQAPELFISSLLVFIFFLNYLLVFYLVIFKQKKLQLTSESFRGAVLLLLLVGYLYVVSAPGTTERYLLPIMIVECMLLAYTLANWRIIFNTDNPRRPTG